MKFQRNLLSKTANDHFQNHQATQVELTNQMHCKLHVWKCDENFEVRSETATLTFHYLAWRLTENSNFAKAAAKLEWLHSVE